MNFNKKNRIAIFENAISWIIVFAMFIYGGAKLIQFDGAVEIDKTVAERNQASMVGLAAKKKATIW